MRKKIAFASFALAIVLSLVSCSRSSEPSLDQIKEDLRNQIGEEIKTIELKEENLQEDTYGAVAKLVTSKEDLDIRKSYEINYKYVDRDWLLEDWKPYPDLPIVIEPAGGYDKVRARIVIEALKVSPQFEDLQARFDLIKTLTGNSTDFSIEKDHILIKVKSPETLVLDQSYIDHISDEIRGQIINLDFEMFGLEDKTLIKGLTIKMNVEDPDGTEFLSVIYQF